MTNSLPQRASALKSEARRTLLANRDQINIAAGTPAVLKSYTDQRTDLIREAAAVLSTTEITDLTGLTRQRIHQILNINPNITQEELNEFYKRFTPEHQSRLRESIISDALKERGTFREARQAEHELTEAVKQYQRSSTSENLTNIWTVAINVLRADALPLQQVSAITDIAEGHLLRAAANTAAPLPPAHLRIPEADV